MPEHEELMFQYDIVEGPTGLRDILDQYLLRSKQDKAFAEVGHYILYTIGDQRSLIRVDTSAIPFHFYYCDLMGRPATKSVKDVISEFLWEKCGEKERYMRQSADKEQL